MHGHGFITSLNISVIFVILLSKRSSAADQQYERCAPRNCGKGPNISFPFYLQGLQEKNCSYPYPGFELNCRADGFPVVNFSGNEYVVESISYGNQSLHVFNAAVSGTGCIPSTIRNTTLPSRFSYVRSRSFRDLYLFSDCTEPLPGKLSMHNLSLGLGCGNWELALLDTNEEDLIRDATENCGTTVVAPVEDDENDKILTAEELLIKGFALNWTATDCSVCEESGGRCGFNLTSLHFRCFCRDRPHSRKCKPGNRVTLILYITIPAVGALLLLCSIASCIIWRRKKKRINTVYRLSRNISSSPSSKPDIEAGSSLYGIPIFSYKQLEQATCNFNPSKELGDGGFGTVYHGKLQDGREVAVKRLYEHNYRRVEQFMNEIKILTSLKHPNLVTLYGCTSRRSRELLLVYEYIPNGTVADHLHGEHAKEAPLSWPVRMSIGIETASALAYLHKTDIIHRDVKTNNILLDNNFCVKVADFGLSRLFPTDVTHISTAPQGTPGYVDPEYHQCYQLTDRSDVYSFGVVLIELISSMTAVDVSRHRHEINLANLAMNRIQRCALDELIDPSLGYGSDPEVTRMTTAVAELAFRCLQLEKDMRPSMDEALTILKDIQIGEDCRLVEKTREATVYRTVAGNIPASPETDAVSLLTNKNYQASPIAVIDVWPSSSSTITSSIG